MIQEFPHAADLADKIDDQGRLCHSGRRRRVGFWGWCSISIAGLLLCALAGSAFFVWTIQRDRNSAFLREHFVALLKSGLGPGNEMMLDQAVIRLAGAQPTFSIRGLAVSNPETGAYAELDRADFKLASRSLLMLAPEAKSISFEGLKLVVPKARDSDAPLSANEALTLLRATLAAVNFAVSGQDPAFRALDAIEGRGISILQRQQDGKTSLVQTGLTATVVRQGETGILARIATADGGHAVEFSGRSDNAPNGERTVLVESADLKAADLFGVFGQVVKGIDPGLRVAVKFHSRLTANDVLAETAVSLSAHGGRIELPDPDMPPFALDEAALDLRIKPGEPDIRIDRVQVRFNETNILAHGRLAPMPQGEDGVRLELKTDRADIDRLSAGEDVLALDSVDIEGVIASNLRSFRLNRLAVREDEGSLLGSGRFSIDNGGLIETTVEAKNLGIRKSLRVWPVWIAPNVRRWMVDHIETGRIEQLSLRSTLAGESLYNAFNRLPIPDEALDVRYTLGGVRLRAVHDAKPIENIAASGVSTGKTANITFASAGIAAGGGQMLAIRDARIHVGDTTRKPAILEMTVPVAGPIRGLLAFLEAPSLKAIVGLPTEIAVSGGTFDGQVKITLPVALKVAAGDTRVEISADLRQVEIDNVVKGEKLEAGTFQLSSKAGVLALKGEGRIFGVSSRIELRGAPGKTPVATVKTTLDDALLARKGFDFRPGITGSLAATFTVPIGGNAGVGVDLDLAQMKIDAGLPGASKRPGQSGRLKFLLLSRPEGAVLSDIEADLGGFSARGKVELQKDNQFGQAELSSIRLSGGDNARLAIERSRGVLKFTLRGNSFDVRPFLRGLQSGAIEEKKAAEGRPVDFDLDLQTTVLVGFNGELMSAADLDISRRQGRVNKIALKARFGAAPVSIATTGQSGALTTITVESMDGGALARFLDIYPRAYGGRLNADLSLGARSQEGVVQLRDFTIRDEPALRQVGAAGPPGQQLARSADEVQFTKLRADFTRQQGQLVLREAVMWGGELGGTLEGTLDYARDRVSLKGAFVPAYALNNFFAKVPIIGRILGGGQYEGLFAVPFVITGKASAPVLRTNPVSAIAPGFLRKFFEIQREK